MTGRCSKCKEMCETRSSRLVKCGNNWPRAIKKISREYLSNCCGAPLLADGERSHDE